MFDYFESITLKQGFFLEYLLIIVDFVSLRQEPNCTNFSLTALHRNLPRKMRRRMEKMKRIVTFIMSLVNVDHGKLCAEASRTFAPRWMAIASIGCVRNNGVAIARLGSSPMAMKPCSYAEIKAIITIPSIPSNTAKMIDLARSIFIP